MKRYASRKTGAWAPGLLAMASFAAAAVFNPVMALAADSDDGLIAPPGAAFSGGNPAPPTPWFGIAVSPANKLLDCPATNLGNQWVLTYSRCSELDDPFDPGFSTIVRYNVGGEAGPNGLGPLLQAMAHPIPDAGGIYGTPMLAKVAGPASADVAPLDFTSAVRVGDEGVILTWSWWPLNYISQLPVRVISLVPDGILVRRKDGIQGCKREFSIGITPTRTGVMSRRLARWLRAYANSSGTFLP